MKTTLIVTALAMGFGISTVFAAPIGVHAPVGTTAPATRSVAPAAAPGAAAVPAPSALRPDLVVQNNSVSLGGRPIAFGSTAGIVSTAIAQPSGAQRGRERVPSCSFNGSFTIRNAGGGPAPAVDVYTWFEQPQGPQVGKISDMGYGNPALAPGGTQTWSFGATLEQGSYVFHLVIDPKHLNRQYALNLNLSCGYGSIPQRRAPAAQPQAPAGFAPVPSGGIKLAQPKPKPKPKGIFMRIQGIAGESKDASHPGWIELASLSWGVHNAGSGAATARNRVSGPGCNPAEITVTKYADKSDPALRALALGGKGTDITIADNGLTVQLREAQITSIQAQASGGSDLRARESLTLVGCR